MAYVVIVHILGEDPLVAEMEELPSPADNCVVFSRARRRDGKAIPYLAEGVQRIFFPWERINFIEVMGMTRREQTDVEFFRE